MRNDSGLRKVTDRRVIPLEQREDDVKDLDVFHFFSFCEEEGKNSVS